MCKLPYWCTHTLAIDFVLLEQVTFTSTTTTCTITINTITTPTVDTDTGSINNKPVPMPRHMSPLDSNEVLQNRNSAEQEANSPDSVAKNTPSIVPPKPQPKPRKLKPATNTDHEQMLSCSASPDGTSSAVGNMGTVSSCQNVSERNLPGPHIAPAMEQFAMYSEESTDVAGNFQANTQ